MCPCECAGERFRSMSNGDDGRFFDYPQNGMFCNDGWRNEFLTRFPRCFGLETHEKVGRKILSSGLIVGQSEKSWKNGRFSESSARFVARTLTQTVILRKHPRLTKDLYGMEGCLGYDDLARTRRQNGHDSVCQSLSPISGRITT